MTTKTEKNTEEARSSAAHGSAHWQVFSDTLKREVAVAPVEITVLTISSLGALTLRVGATGVDPRETCVAAIAKCYQDADEHKQHAEGAAALGNRDCEGNHVLARAEAVRLARAIEVLVHCYDKGIHGRKWPVGNAPNVTRSGTAKEARPNV